MITLDIDKSDCRLCIHWDVCECGKIGHEKGTSIGFSPGKCDNYIPRRTVNHERQTFGNESDNCHKSKEGE